MVPGLRHGLVRCASGDLSLNRHAPTDADALVISLAALRITAIWVRNDQDLPVYGGVPSMRAPVSHTAGYYATSPFLVGDAVAAFGHGDALGT